MIEKYRNKIQPGTEFVARYFSWLHPNTISIVGFLFGFIPVYFYIHGQPLFAGIGLLVYFFDFLDGAVARLTKKASTFGEVLDASLDRVTDGLIIFSIIYGGFVSWELGVFVMMGFFLVSYIRARAEAAARKVVKLDVGFAQRGERVIILMLASVFYFEHITIPVIDVSLNSLQFVFIVLGVLTWETVIYRLWKAFSLFKNSKYEG
jgi:archaetidylinositol phosphate synthase